jgi:hypothetical protein
VAIAAGQRSYLERAGSGRDGERRSPSHRGQSDPPPSELPRLPFPRRGRRSQSSARTPARPSIFPASVDSAACGVRCVLNKFFHEALLAVGCGFDDGWQESRQPVPCKTTRHWISVHGNRGRLGRADARLLYCRVRVRVRRGVQVRVRTQTHLSVDPASRSQFQRVPTGLEPETHLSQPAQPKPILDGGIEPKNQFRCSC